MQVTITDKRDVSRTMEQVPQSCFFVLNGILHQKIEEIELEDGTNLNAIDVINGTTAYVHSIEEVKVVKIEIVIS